jgi:hypothetical protein
MRDNPGKNHKEWEVKKKHRQAVDYFSKAKQGGEMNSLKITLNPNLIGGLILRCPPFFFVPVPLPLDNNLK